MPKRNIVARTHPRPQSLRFFLSRGRRNVNDILRRVALGTRIARTWQNNYNTMQHQQMLHEKSDHFQISANNSQHVATRRHRVAKRRQHVAPNNVAICCVEMLRSFGRSFTRFLQWGGTGGREPGRIGGGRGTGGGRGKDGKWEI